jgi:hypothetical protein
MPRLCEYQKKWWSTNRRPYTTVQGGNESFLKNYATYGYFRKDWDTLCFWHFPINIRVLRKQEE